MNNHGNESKMNRKPEKGEQSKTAVAFVKAERIAGKIIQEGACFLLHYMIMKVILQRLGIDFLSYPDTFEYRIMMAYLLLTQFVFVIWCKPKILKMIDYLTIPINHIGSRMERKLELYFEGKEEKEK